MNVQQLIEFYGEGITDFETSPFEMLEAFRVRSELENLTLTREEQKKLALYDMKLLLNSQQAYNHVKEVYDFSMSQERQMSGGGIWINCLKGNLKCMPSRSRIVFRKEASDKNEKNRGHFNSSFIPFPIVLKNDFWERLFFISTGPADIYCSKCSMQWRLINKQAACCIIYGVQNSHWSFGIPMLIKATKREFLCSL